MAARMETRQRLDGQTGAALGTARVDHAATTNGFHANEKAVGFLAAGNGGLIGTFHSGFTLLLNMGWDARWLGRLCHRCLPDLLYAEPRIILFFQGFRQPYVGETAPTHLPAGRPKTPAYDAGFCG